METDVGAAPGESDATMRDMDLRASAARHDRILTRRLDELIPRLMRRAGFDAWVIAAREYNEDPVIESKAVSNPRRIAR